MFNKAFENINLIGNFAKNSLMMAWFRNLPQEYQWLYATNCQKLQVDISVRSSKSYCWMQIYQNSNSWRIQFALELEFLEEIKLLDLIRWKKILT